MHRHRLDRLAKLTRGAALVGLGAAFACHDDPPHTNGPAPDPTPHINATAEPVHTNAPPAPDPSAAPTAAPSVAPSASGGATPHTVNAPLHVNSPAPRR